jgi:hypothetical protein
LGEVVEVGGGLLGVVGRDDEPEGVGDVFVGIDLVELDPDE